jgi:hypothetical protein
MLIVEIGMFLLLGCVALPTVLDFKGPYGG